MPGCESKTIKATLFQAKQTNKKKVYPEKSAAFFILSTSWPVHN